MSTHTFEIPEMTCGHCVATVESAAQGVSGVRSVAVDLATKQVEVVGGNQAELRTALAAAGYPADPADGAGA